MSSTSFYLTYSLIVTLRLLLACSIFTKNQEFYTWLVEERKINPETVSKDQQKKEFSRFVEDYNTGTTYVTSYLYRLTLLKATLPHEKYYNMEAYESRMSALRQGEYLPPANDSYDFQADMKAVTSQHKKKVTEQDTYMSKDQLMELRRVQQERSEVIQSSCFCRVCYHSNHFFRWVG